MRRLTAQKSHVDSLAMIDRQYDWLLDATLAIAEADDRGLQLRMLFSTLACEVLGAEIAVVDRILNHVATATTSKIMRIYNKSELFEPRRRVLREWAVLIEREAAGRVARRGAG